MPGQTAPRTAGLAISALLCFAANSILCRKALGAHAIDAASFTAVRIGAGAITLAILLAASGRWPARFPGRWAGAVALFAYAAAFSYAYVRIPAGVGALVLFGAVQLTMLGWAIRRGERPAPLEWVGFVVAAAGLVSLTLPGSSAPDLVGVGIMAAAGVAWGVYSLLGRGPVDPLAATAGNFLRAVPFAVALALPARETLHASTSGLVLAAVSGALASGVGYTIWYAALRGLTATRAAISQLSVPALAAAAGIVLLGETLTLRVAVGGSVILLGVGVAILGRARRI